MGWGPTAGPWPPSLWGALTEACWCLLPDSTKGSPRRQGRHCQGRQWHGWCLWGPRLAEGGKRAAEAPVPVAAKPRAPRGGLVWSVFLSHDLGQEPRDYKAAAQSRPCQRKVHPSIQQTLPCACASLSCPCLVPSQSQDPPQLSVLEVGGGGGACSLHRAGRNRLFQKPGRSRVI